MTKIYQVYFTNDSGMITAKVKANDRKQAFDIVKKYKGNNIHLLSVQLVKA